MHIVLDLIVAGLPEQEPNHDGDTGSSETIIWIIAPAKQSRACVHGLLLFQEKLALMPPACHGDPY